MGYVARNDPCHCGSGKKYKKCCLPKEEQKLDSARTVQESLSDDWGYELFGARFQEIAEDETRNITIMDGGRSGLPDGIYIFHEMFCREHGCDCRRVFFMLHPRHDTMQRRPCVMDGSR